jgi:hypothetical protein
MDEKPVLKKRKKHWAIALFSVILIAVVFSAIGNYSRGSYTTRDPDNNPAGNDPVISAPGYCSVHKDCRDFGTRNCGGYQFGLCGEDSLCHCCVPLNNQRCISCQEVNCPSSDRYCLGGETGACAFKLGGKTSD